MKNVLFALALASFGAYAENYTVKLDWNDKNTLNDNIAMVCDDAFYTGFQLVVPGKAGKDFQISLETSINSGQLDPECDILKKETSKGTMFLFKNVRGTCEIHVHKIRTDFREKPQSGSYIVSDAC